MIYKSLVISSMLALSFCSFAETKGSTYLNMNLGAGWLSDTSTDDSGLTFNVKSNMGPAGSIAYGYSQGNLRAEGELAYQENDLDKLTVSGVEYSLGGKTRNSSLMLNGYYDFTEAGNNFYSYLGVGIGFARVQISDLTIGGVTIKSYSDNVFAYQASLGIGYLLDKKNAVEIRYKYYGTQKPNFDGSKFENTSSIVYLGYKHFF